MCEEKSHVGMAKCFFCLEPGMILLDRRLKKSLPRDCGVVDMTPCSKCNDYMKQGIILISISDDTTKEDMKGPIPNPYRTGGWVVVKQEAVERFGVGDALLDFAIKHRFAFIADAAWLHLGLPMGEEDSI